MICYRACPACGEEDAKCLRLVGEYEYDTNAGEDIEVDTTLSCKCELTAEQWGELMRGLGYDDFSPVYLEV